MGAPLAPLAYPVTPECDDRVAAGSCGHVESAPYVPLYCASFSHRMTQFPDMSESTALWVNSFKGVSNVQPCHRKQQPQVWMPPFDPQFVIGYAAITCMQKAEFTYLHFESRGKIYSPGLLGVIDPKGLPSAAAFALISPNAAFSTKLDTSGLPASSIALQKFPS